MHTKAINELYDRVIFESAAAGKLVETGWLAMLASTNIHKLSPETRDRLKYVYFAGAQHVFAAMVQILDAPDDGSHADRERVFKALDNTASELDAWVKSVKNF